MKKKRSEIGVIGCGNMGSALIRGMVESEHFPSRGIIAWDPDTGKLNRLVQKYEIQAASSDADAANARIVLLAVKPQQMGQVIAEIKPKLTRSSLLISIAAGIPTVWIEKRVAVGVPVVRVMPNTPASVRKGVSAITRGRAATSNHIRKAEKVFSAVGDEVVQIKESQMDAVTAISGSGPAYFFYLMEAMIHEARQMHIDEAVARRLVLETAAGAAKLAKESEEDPSVLRKRVTSKGGTTEAAIKQFDKAGLNRIIYAGIRAAARRAKELSS